MQRWLNTLLMVVGLWIGLACGGDTDDRMVRRYARCLTDTNTTLHRLTASGASGTVTRRDGRGLDGWSDDLGADDAAHPQSRGSITGRRNPAGSWPTESPHGSVYVMTLMRGKAGINKESTPEDGCPNRVGRCVAAGLSDDGSQLSPISWLDPPRDLVLPKFSNICFEAMRLKRRYDGLWFGNEGPRYKKVIGIVMFYNVYPHSVKESRACFYPNPYVETQLPAWAKELPHAEYGPDGSMRLVEGRKPVTFIDDYVRFERPWQ